MIGLSEMKEASIFDSIAGLGEDHDPKDGAKLREMLADVMKMIGECKNMPPADDHTKKCAEIESKLAAMKSIVEKL